jgi:anaerobic selenocysteine-containing dehydrogenase
MAVKKNPANTTNGEKTFVKALTMISEMGVGSNPVMVDVKDGKIIRLHPLHYDWKQSQKDLGYWEMEARGKKLRPTYTALLTPHNLGYKKRVYSPNRVMYPLKRVDWDPNGNRNPEKRGESKYVRISWDEATDIVVSELNRIKAKYGMSGVYCAADGHGETKIVHPAHACNALLLKELGGYTWQARNPDSWEGLYWGAKHVWGMDPVGLENQLNVVPDVAQNADMILFWGADPETTTWAFGGQIWTRVLSWWHEIGMKFIFINPDLNYGAGVHADKWIPILPNTDAAMRLAIAYTWITEGTYDKEYVKTHVYGFDKFSDYVLGKEDGVAKTPAWAAPICEVPSRTIKALARDWAKKTVSFAKCQGGGLRGPYSSEPGRLEVVLLGMQGLGKPGVHQIMTGPLVVVDPPKSSVHGPFLNPMDAYRGTEIPRQLGELHGRTRREHINTWQPEGWAPPLAACKVTWDDDRSNKPPAQIIAKDLLHEAILNPPVSWYSTTGWGEPVEDQFVKYTYPARPNR